MKIGPIVIFLWNAWFISAATFIARPHPLVQVVFLTMGLAMFALILLSLMAGAARWKNRGAKGLVVFAISVGLLLLGPASGFGLKRLVFKYHLPRYEAAAAWLERQKIEADSIYVNTSMPKEFAKLSSAVHAIKNPECGLVAWFFWGFEFPPKHTARIYASDDSLSRPECLGEWEKLVKIAAHWYEASGSTVEPNPDLPYVHQGSMGQDPDAECRYGPWHVRLSTEVHKKPRPGSETLFSLSPGDRLEPLREETHVVPGAAKVLKKFDAGYGAGPILTPGAMISLREYVGQGAREVFYKDRIFLMDIYSDVFSTPGVCRPDDKKKNCRLSVLRPPQEEWWALVHSQETNRKGWILVSGENVDTCNK